MAFYQLFHLILHEIERFGCFMLKSGFFSKSLVLCLNTKIRSTMLSGFELHPHWVPLLFPGPADVVPPKLFIRSRENNLLESSLFIHFTSMRKKVVFADLTFSNALLLASETF